MNQKYFIFPFATAGDLTEIPNPTQGSGVVSYQQGFGSLYSEDPLTNGLTQPTTAALRLVIASVPWCATVLAVTHLLHLTSLSLIT
jgi:hypothetical protein